MIQAIRQGLRHVAAAPGLLVFLWLVNLLVAVPAAVIVGEEIHQSVRWSQANERLRQGFDNGWYGEFNAEADGLAATFAQSQVGVGAALDALEAWWRGGLFQLPPAVLVLGFAFACVWLFLMGGILTRLHRPWEHRRISDVVAAGSTYFARFVRLAILAGAGYWCVFRFARWLFPWIGELTRDLTAERTVLLYNLLAAALVVGLMGVIKAVFDYAKISMVVEGRHSAVGAALRGAAFVLRRPFATGGLLATFGLLAALSMAAYARLAPGAGQETRLTILLAIAGSQVYLLLRLALRLGLLGSELALYERRNAPR